MKEFIKKEKIIAIFREKNHDKLMEQINATIKGGIKIIELTYSIPDVNALIPKIKEQHKNIVIGVGSVINKNMAKQSIKAGANFIISPGYGEDINRICRTKKILYIPGCMTLTEIMRAYNGGNKIIKLFPANFLGANFIKTVKAPIPNIDIIPTGGIDIDNIDIWLKNGIFAIGIGDSLFKSDNIKDIENLSRQFIEKKPAN